MDSYKCQTFAVSPAEPGDFSLFVKKITKPMMGFKAFHSAQATIDGIETAHMIRKGQLFDESVPAYMQFMALAGQFYPQIIAGCSLRNICDTTKITLITSRNHETIINQMININSKICSM